MVPLLAVTTQLHDDSEHPQSPNIQTCVKSYENPSCRGGETGRRTGLKRPPVSTSSPGRWNGPAALPTKGTAAPSFYYQTTLDALQNDGDILVTLDVLAKQVGVLGIFSDRSGTVSYYASCMGLK